ncbi:cytochrome P450 [Sporodiniella umbellata]|nr:cytochrome P450 [Sporodiniella umbellata]
MKSSFFAENAQVVTLAGLSLISIYLLIQRKLKEDKDIKKIPYPSSVSWPVLALASSPVQKISDWHKEAGPIYKIDVGDQLWIMIDNPYLAHDVFVTAGSTTSSRPHHYFLSEIHALNDRGVAFSKYGNIWKNNRKAVSNALKPTSVDKLSQAISSEYERLVSQLAEVASKGEAFDPFVYLQMAAINTVLIVVTGKGFVDIEDPLYQEIREIADDTEYYSGIEGDLIPTLPSLFLLEKFLGLKSKMSRHLKKRKHVYEKLIEETLQSGRPSLIKDMFQVKDEQGSPNYDDILVIMGDIISGGSGTVSNIIHWTFALLSQYPEAQEKITQELDEWKTKNPSRNSPNFLEDRESFIYSICVQKEILRLCPPAPFGVQHTCTEDTIVNGYIIPKNAVIFSSMVPMHRQSSIYDDPEAFRPERFLKKTKNLSVLSNAKAGDRDIYTFGWGRRICPGIYTTEQELFMFYVHFFSKFRIESELDTNGNPIKANPMEYREFGIAMKSTLEKFRVVPRSR